jgi:hypothetical protein
MVSRNLMQIDAADAVATLLAVLAVPMILLGGLFRGARSHAGRAVAVATRNFGVMLLALIVPVLGARLFGAAPSAVWTWLHSS